MKRPRTSMTRLIYFLSYLLRSFHLHGIHSPFVFQLIHTVLREKAAYYAYEEIESIRAKLLLTQKRIRVNDLGASSKNSYEKSIQAICQQSSQSKKFAQMIHRLARDLHAETILELGTSLGLTTAYLAKACPNAKVISIEGAEEISRIAEINLKKLQVRNVKLQVGSFQDRLVDSLNELGKIDLVYFDGHHNYEASLDYFNACLPYVHDKSLFIFDDIYWSTEMKKAWREIITNKKVSCSIDLFQIGLIYFDPTLTHQNFTVYHSANFYRS